MTRPPIVRYGPFPVSMPVLEVIPGDEWTSDKDTVVIDKVEHLHPNGTEDARVKLHGRIVRGFGRGTRTRTWSFVIEQRLEIVRRPR